MIRGHLWIYMGLLMVSISVGVKAQTSIVGQVLTVQGRVAVEHGKVQPKTCLGLDQLRAGDTLTTSGGASATIVLYENGARYALSAGSKAQVQQAALKGLSGPPPHALKALSRAFVRPMRHLAQGLGPNFGGEIARPLQDPRIGPCHSWPKGAVRESTVQLRWEGPVEPETEMLRVRIRDAEGGKAIDERDMSPSEREFVVPAGLLKLDHWYVWSVTAIGPRGAGQTCGGSILMLTANERAELEAKEQEATRMRKANPDDLVPDLLLAQEYERLSLFAEARKAYETALRFGPNPGAEAALKRLKR